MPSNTFKASQLIAHLQTLISEHGDCDVTLPIVGADRIFAVTLDDVRAVSSFNNRPLGRTAFAIEPRDKGRDYSAEAEPETGAPWNYDLAAAPEGEPLKIYKRIGGAGTGLRKNGKWFLLREDGRPLEIAPGGVLGWRK